MVNPYTPQYILEYIGWDIKIPTTYISTGTSSTPWESPNPRTKQPKNGRFSTGNGGGFTNDLSQKRIPYRDERRSFVETKKSRSGASKIPMVDFWIKQQLRRYIRSVLNNPNSQKNTAKNAPKPKALKRVLKLAIKTICGGYSHPNLRNGAYLI